MARASAAGIKRGTAKYRRYLAEEVLPRAGRVIGNVIAQEARANCVSDEVRGTIKVRVEKGDGGIVRVFVETRGRAAFRAPWLEYGTDEHWIDNQNLRPRKQALLINGRLVKGPVFHPGARAVPFLRPAFDLKTAEAFAAGQRFIDRADRRFEDGDE